MGSGGQRPCLELVGPPGGGGGRPCVGAAAANAKSRRAYVLRVNGWGTWVGTEHRELKGPQPVNYGALICAQPLARRAVSCQLRFDDHSGGEKVLLRGRIRSIHT